MYVYVLVEQFDHEQSVVLDCFESVLGAKDWLEDNYPGGWWVGGKFVIGADENTYQCRTPDHYWQEFSIYKRELHSSW